MKCKNCGSELQVGDRRKGFCVDCGTPWEVVEREQRARPAKLDEFAELVARKLEERLAKRQAETKPAPEPEPKNEWEE